MELERLTLSDNKSENDKYHMIAHIWNLEYGINEPIYKTETDL